MEFDWSEDKRRKNFAKHGLDFADVALMDWTSATILEDARTDMANLAIGPLACCTGACICGHSRCMETEFGPSVFAKRTERKLRDMAKRKMKPSAYGVPDADIPEMKAADFRKAKPVKDVMPGLISAAKRARGRPRSANPKQHVSLRLDAKVVAGFKAQGPGWQGRINEVLARALGRSGKRKPSRSARST